MPQLVWQGSGFVWLTGQILQDRVNAAEALAVIRRPNERRGQRRVAVVVVHSY